ncbi:recombinase family protein [Paenibacillus sp. RC67]|uniref:recombinase family protein n=1 Tax=Paenibacillus sp. RC67 TaxID=3039392 RepID=UPI0024AE1B28|nr:recombinase family protein [Paenibacillus sp. RC67]
MITNKTKVAIYARTNQGQERSDQQFKALRAYCEENGKEIYAEYVDEGASGFNMERPRWASTLVKRRGRSSCSMR